MSKNLVIVESPAKAKTIEKFLGKDYKVKSSFGHVRDLAKKNFGIDIKNNFEPEYIIMPDKKKVISDLKKDVKNANTVILASDEDREGEAIAWHLFEVLNLKNKKTQRIVFNEITKEAIKEAVENPGSINYDLVNAQQARRILDRLVGFELSSVLWKKVQSKLSAGRVQSVAVRLLVEREREISSFKPDVFFKVTGEFISEKNKEKFKAELNKKFKTEKDILNFFENLGQPDYYVADVERKPGKRSPSAPFTTSSLQQEAGRKLGFPVGKTMRIAQKLYEAGYITYMRTDSVNLSSLALNAAKEVIIKEYGEKYYKKRVFKTKTKNAQEAHEAIRPTYLSNPSVQGTSDEERLYDLIRKRTLASQMADAEFERTNVTVSIKNSDYKFTASGEVMKFPGFLKLYTVPSEDTVLPDLKKNEPLKALFLEAVEQFGKSPSRYSEAALVKQLEEKGIGRPSTYAPTISTIENRGYMIKESRPGIEKEILHLTLKDGKIIEKTERKIFGAEKNKLFPTDIAMVVTDFLSENFQNIIDYNFTANVEKQFDEIAEGKIIWHKMIKDFYDDFHKKVEDTIEHADRNSGERILGQDPETGKQVSVRLGKYGPVAQLGTSDDDEKPKFASLRKDQHIENITLEEALELLKNSGNGRLLGQDPETGKNVYVRFARYGAVAQLGDSEDSEKPKYAGLLKGMNIDTVTLDEVLKLFKLPREVGIFEGKKVIAAVGRFGPYIRHDSKFVSLKKTDDPLTITIERAKELILEKREKDKKRLIKEFPENKDLKIIKDRWGKPCIYYNKKYIRLSSKIKPEELTYDECLKITEKEFGPVDKKKKSSRKTKNK
ncbi:MAG: type I DNA topoisomerase [Chlorobi bacterium]|nr:type I DNA topoisomerase [Chlorobiota bacterium]